MNCPINGEELPELLDHHVLDVVFIDGLFVAGLVPAVGYTLVIVVFLFRLTRPANASHIRFFLSQFRKGDINDPKYRQGLVDMLVNKIYLYDDKMTNAAVPPGRTTSRVGASSQW